MKRSVTMNRAKAASYRGYTSRDLATARIIEASERA